MSWKALSCSFALWITLASLGNAYSTISLNPSKENTLIQTTNPNAQVSNALGDLYVGETAQSSIRRGLIEFDIADHIPATATITGGTLTMTDVQGLNGNQALTLQATLQNWGAGTSYSSGATGAAATNGDATWLYASYNAGTPSNSTSWATSPGGNFSPTVSASAVDVGTGSAGYQVVWSSQQMINDLQSWANGSLPNYGWTILGNESPSTAKRLYGDNNTYDPSNVQPLLTVSYAVPEPAAAWLAISGLLALAVVKGRRARQAIDFLLRRA